MIKSGAPSYTLSKDHRLALGKIKSRGSFATCWAPWRTGRGYPMQRASMCHDGYLPLHCVLLGDKGWNDSLQMADTDRTASGQESRCANSTPTGYCLFPRLNQFNTLFRAERLVDVAASIEQNDVDPEQPESDLGGYLSGAGGLLGHRFGWCCGIRVDGDTRRRSGGGHGGRVGGR